MATPALQSLEKALALLDAVAADRAARPLAELAGTVSLPASTAYRMAASFERAGYLSRVSRGRYLPGPALVALARTVELEPLLIAVGRPVVRDLSRRTGRAAHLGVLQDDMVTYLLKAAPRGQDLFTREGMQLEAYCSGIGKVLLSALPDEDRERYLASGPFVSLTPNTIIDAAALRRELEQVRAQQFALDAAEVSEDLACIAAPVRDGRGEVVAALSVSSAGGGADPQAMQTHLAALRQAAGRLEATIAHQNRRAFKCSPKDLG